jgi:Protein of unknown function (DUF3153)
MLKAFDEELTPDMLKSAPPVMPTTTNKRSWGQTIRGWVVVLLTSLCLSGCVRYDVGVTFDSQTHGEIVQQIRLSQRLTNFSQITVQEWLDSIDRRARSLHGRTKRINDRELTVKIPFNNGAELVEKFNGFFNPTAAETDLEKTASTSEFPQLGANLNLKQNNAFVALRNRLSVDLDLRGLVAIADAENTVEIGTDSLFDIDFSLDTHFEVVFWVPSPIGIGAISIVLLIVVGHFLKHRIFPALGWERQPKKRKPVSVNS